MGSTANKMGGVAGQNAVLDSEEDYESFEGVLGTNLLKIFNYTVAKTGLSEKQAKEEGFYVEYERLKRENLTILDVRSEAEFMILSIPRSINIPFERVFIFDKILLKWYKLKK